MIKIKVLLADDHAIVRAGIRRTIEEIETLRVVIEASNGPQTFDGLRHEQIDCLIIDVNMPDFEPISAITNIRILYPNLKILVVSAYDDDFYVQGLFRAGINGYHLKDQPLNDLKLAIVRVLAGERWISSALIQKLIEPREKGGDLPKLTNRQKELLQFLHRGLDNQTISKEMGLSIKTVEKHLTSLYRQLNVSSRLEAVNHAQTWPQLLSRSGQQAETNEKLTEIGSTPSLSILVVDDNQRYRNHLQRMIGKLFPQATLFEADDIQTAVQLSQRISPHMVFLDVVLGEEDGLRCASRIKAISPTSRIVLITAYPDREFHRLGLEAGAVALLDKRDLDLLALKQLINDLF
ncbi:MAG: response regulator transcription factor [Chloroflexi bacterium]|nr:response regulator transcription factor [Chloroflexota bacterium]